MSAHGFLWALGLGNCFSSRLTVLTSPSGVGHRSQMGAWAAVTVMSLGFQILFLVSHFMSLSACSMEIACTGLTVTPLLRGHGCCSDGFTSQLSQLCNHGAVRVPA